ncbi:MAG: HAD-IC family P-type ATPase, partial [Candidatus Micrarchaeia archaeon]
MPHSKSAEEVLRELQSSAQGISDREAELRLKAYGANEFGKGKKRGLVELVLGQFKNYLLVLLLAAAAVAYLINHQMDALAIGVVVVLNVVFGVALEYGADRSMEELKKLAETKALVMREGRKDLIDSRLLVPGDIVFLEEGAKVPADARIMEEQGLEINESSLTGESMPVRKNVGKLAKGTPVAERSCMVYAGTFVAKGRGNAVVVATGPRTEFGAVEKGLGEVKEEQTTLEKGLAELGKNITLASFAIVAVLFAAGLAFGKWTMSELFIYSVSIVVAAVPEGMLTVLTLVLAIGVKNMAREHALVRKLQAVETLGNVTFIATDKTGTITEGRMALLKIYDGKMRDFGELSGTEKILSYSYVCNSAHMTEEGVVGDETD